MRPGCAALMTCPSVTRRSPVSRCGSGNMFFPDLAAATAEFARVLKPGGRPCSSVWAGPGENPWTTIVMQAIAAEAMLAPPAPDGPGMFRCAAPGYVSALYRAAGLREVAERDVGVELTYATPCKLPAEFGIRYGAK